MYTWGLRSRGGTEGGGAEGRERRREKKQICKFTKSCTSQCLSCFAAPISVVRAETSVTGSLARRSHKLTTAKLQSAWLMTKTAETFLATSSRSSE